MAAIPGVRLDVFSRICFCGQLVHSRESAHRPHRCVAAHVPIACIDDSRPRTLAWFEVFPATVRCCTGMSATFVWRSILQYHELAMDAWSVAAAFSLDSS